MLTECGEARILLPLEQVEGGEAKIPVATSYARMMGAQVVLLHVLPPRALDSSAVLPEEARARTYLDTIAAQIHAAGESAATVVRSGLPARIIVDEAETIGARLIILGANVRSKLATLLTGSVADEVVRSATCPVLLVHPEARVQFGGLRTLRSFHADSARMGALTRRHLGVRTIEVARIVGSESRAQDFGPDFRRGEHRLDPLEDQRFTRVLVATRRGAALPPIVVFQLGFGYYVEDGHHRVAAARLNGQTEIDADVTEFVPVEREASALFVARSAFEQATGLADLGAARAESYPILQRTIERFGRDERLPELRHAARRWEGQVYRPLWAAIRARQLSAAFPGDRTADSVARVAELREQCGLDWEQALDAIAR
ncbi:MAG TPA: universal stress protein [Chloroflexota bacterium]|nr:universal stress protein [Chloroflexota bacterium]